jgi:hypothetical protein
VVDGELISMCYCIKRVDREMEYVRSAIQAPSKLCDMCVFALVKPTCRRFDDRELGRACRNSDGMTTRETIRPKVCKCKCKCKCKRSSIDPSMPLSTPSDFQL